MLLLSTAMLYLRITTQTHQHITWYSLS